MTGAAASRCDDLALVPGPSCTDLPLFSTDVREIVEYPASRVVDAWRALPGFEVTSDPTPSWWAWRGRYAPSGVAIELDLTLFDVGDAVWGGSGLSGPLDVDAIERLWGVLLEAGLTSVYLHGPDCRMYAHDEGDRPYSVSS